MIEYYLKYIPKRINFLVFAAAGAGLPWMIFWANSCVWTRKYLPLFIFGYIIFVALYFWLGGIYISKIDERSSGKNIYVRDAVIACVSGAVAGFVVSLIVYFFYALENAIMPG